MIRRRSFLTVLVMGLIVGCAPAWGAQKKIRIVTTITVFKDIAANVGGDRVEVTAIAPPTLDVHFIEPRPSDILLLTRAEFFVHAGLDLELWRGPLVEAARNAHFFPGGDREIDCTQGVPLLEVPTRPLSRAQGDIHIFGNPHYWLDPANGKVIAQNIANKLSTFYPQDRSYFEQNLQRFNQQLDLRMKEWATKMAPFRGREIVAYHKSWPYFAERFGLKIELFLEPKPNIPPSGAHLNRVIEEMKQRRLRVIIIEPHYPKRTAETVARYVEGLVLDFPGTPGAVPGADTYLAMFDYQISKLTEALRQ